MCGYIAYKCSSDSCDNYLKPGISSNLLEFCF